MGPRRGRHSRGAGRERVRRPARRTGLPGGSRFPVPRRADVPWGPSVPRRSLTVGGRERGTARVPHTRQAGSRVTASLTAQAALERGARPPLAASRSRPGKSQLWTSGQGDRCLPGGILPPLISTAEPDYGRSGTRLAGDGRSRGGRRGSAVRGRAEGGGGAPALAPGRRRCPPPSGASPPAPQVSPVCRPRCPAPPRLSRPPGGPATPCPGVPAAPLLSTPPGGAEHPSHLRGTAQPAVTPGSAEGRPCPTAAVPRRPLWVRGRPGRAPRPGGAAARATGPWRGAGGRGKGPRRGPALGWVLAGSCWSGLLFAFQPRVKCLLFLWAAWG